MQEHALLIFGLRFFVSRHWRCPLRDVRMEILRDLFTEFCTAFPDHANEENTDVWLLYHHRPNSYPGHSYSLLWTCDHFEDSDEKDIQQLAAFMSHLASLSNSRHCSLALLDGNREHIILELHDAVLEVIEHLKKHGAEGSGEDPGKAQ